MGTNYYQRKNPCECCGRSDEQRHIGKSSAGWHFSLRIYPDEGISTLADWLPLLMMGGIYDEYGDKVTPMEMLNCIMNRRRPEPPKNFDHAMNQSEVGFNNLIRPRAREGHLPTSVSEGTWDYCNYEFS